MSIAKILIGVLGAGVTGISGAYLIREYAFKDKSDDLTSENQTSRSSGEEPRQQEQAESSTIPARDNNRTGG